MAFKDYLSKYAQNFTAPGLFGMFNGKQEDPMQYLNQIPEKTGQYLNPYIQQGQEAGQMAQGQYNQMTQDPTSFLNQLMSGYQPSQGYQYKADLMGRELANTAAAGGFRGTSEDQRQRAELINSLMGQDMQQYLQNVLGIQGTGLQGQENAMGRGFGASGDMANITGTNLSERSNLRMQQSQQGLQDRQSKLKLLASILGAGFGGMVGGLPGAYVGSQIGGGGGSLSIGGNSNQSGVTGNF